MKTAYNKRRIMRNAWSIKRKNASVSFGECLSIAWAREKIKVEEARRNARSSNYTRVEVRVDRATLEANRANALIAYYNRGSNAYYGD